MWITSNSLSHEDGVRESDTPRSVSPKNFVRVTQDLESMWSSEQTWVNMSTSRALTTGARTFAQNRGRVAEELWSRCMHVPRET